MGVCKGVQRVKLALPDQSDPNQASTTGGQLQFTDESGDHQMLSLNERAGVTVRDTNDTARAQLTTGTERPTPPHM